MRDIPPGTLSPLAPRVSARCPAAVGFAPGLGFSTNPAAQNLTRGAGAAGRIASASLGGDEHDMGRAGSTRVLNLRGAPVAERRPGDDDDDDDDATGPHGAKPSRAPGTSRSRTSRAPRAVREWVA